VTWATIVFQQGEDANTALSMLDESGPAAAVEYLSQWDYGERDDVREEPSWGSADSTHHIVDTEAGFETVLTWNWNLQYVGLHQRTIT
jgi:hypothetical protein